MLNFQKPSSYTFYGGNVVCVPVHVFLVFLCFFFFTLPLIFTLVAAIISLFFHHRYKLFMIFF